MTAPNAPSVLHVITGVDFGGAEMMLIKLLKRRRAPALVLSLLGGGRLADPLRATGAELVELDMPRGRPNLTGMRALWTRARAFAPDVIQGWMYHGNVAASAAHLACGRRPALLWSVHATFIKTGQSPKVRPIVRLSRRLSQTQTPEMTLYVSEQSAQEHRALGFEGAQRIIPIGFDTEAYRPDPQARAEVRAELRLPQDALVLGLIGRFAPMKGFDILARAAPELLDALPSLHILMAGPQVSAENAELMRALPANLHRSSRMHLIGPRQDVPRVLSALDALALPSRFGESFPNIVGEAMACGVPCVASDLGGVSQMVGDAGTLVPPGDEPAFVKAARALLSTPEAERRALSQAARTRIEARFGADQMAAQIHALYETLRTP